MATDLPAIRQRIVVDDSALGGLSARFGKVGRGLGVAVAGGAAVAAAAVGAFVANGVRGAVEVDRGLREVNTLFGETGATAEATFAQMRDGVADLSTEIGVAQDVLTGGLYQAISAGVPRDNVFEFLEVAGKAAIGGVTDTETAVDGLTTVINAWNLESADAAEVADSLFTAVKGGKTTFEELSASLFQVAPAAAAAGVGYDEVNAAIATLTASGTPTAVATTQIRQALVELDNPAGKAAKAFEEISGKSFREFIAAGGDVQGALAILNEEASETGASVGDYFGSVEASAAATALATTNAEKFAQELEAQSGAAGAADAAFEEMEKSTARQMERLRTNLANVGIEVGAKLLPPLNRLIEWATTTLPPAIATVMDWIGRLGEIFAPIIEAVRSLVERFRSGTGEMETRTAELSAFLSTTWEQISGIISSATDVIMGVVTVATEVIRSVWENSGQQILTALRTTWENVKTIIGGALDLIRGIFEIFAGLLTGDWSRLWEGIKTALSGAWRVIRGVVSQLWNVIRTMFSVGISTIRALWSSLWERVKSILSGAWSSIRSTVSEQISRIITYFRNLPGRILRALGDLGSLLLQAGRNILEGLAEGIRDAAMAPVRAVQDAVGAVRDFLPFSPAKRGPLAGSGSPDLAGAKIPRMLAAGIRSEERRVVKAAEAIARAASPNISGPAVDLDTRAAVGPARSGSSIASIERYLRDVADRPIEIGLDLGDGITQRYRLERTREGRGRAIRLGAR